MNIYLRILFKLASSLFLLVVLVYVGINVLSYPFIPDTQSDLQKAHTAIVLGAMIFPDGNMSSILKDRVDRGITLYKNGKVQTILVSGDNGSLTYNEVNPVREYILSKGVPSSDIFLDHAGFDTYSSMYRARDVFLVDSAIIVTQSFHLPRAVFLARTLGIEAYGIPSDQHGYLFRNNIREMLANVKAIIDLVSFRKPKYLGEEIPITGDSSDSI